MNIQDIKKIFDPEEKAIWDRKYRKLGKVMANGYLNFMETSKGTRKNIMNIFRERKCSKEDYS